MKKDVIFRWDHLLATAVVIAVIKFLPILFTIDFLDPIQSTMEDFKAGDIVFSQLKDYNKIPVDTNIVLVNIGYLNRKGIAELINIINWWNEIDFITVSILYEDTLQIKKHLLVFFL